MDKTAPAYLTALAILVADQVTKWFITGPLDLERVQQIVLLPIFNLTWVENRGISLGLAQAQNDTHRWLLVALTAAIALAVAWWIRREDKQGDRLALGLVLGGAIGNIVDRVRFGYVVDFLDLHFGEVRPFYVFNVADAAISIGVVILLLRAFLIRDTGSKKNKVPEGTNEHA
ncbi:MAG: signal peptidase II [Pseudomonadota bacterium]|nr:signal peptidase II [Pseudomonadota bacterium]